MSRSLYRLLGVALLCPLLAFGNGRPCAAGTFFNTYAFVDPQPGSFGSVSLNSLRGPGYKNWDGSLIKNIPVGRVTASRSVESFTIG